MKNIFENKEMVFKKWVEKIFTAGYNDSIMVLYFKLEFLRLQQAEISGFKLNLI